MLTWRAAHPQMGFFAEAGPMQVFVSNYVRTPAARSLNCPPLARSLTRADCAHMCPSLAHPGRHVVQRRGRAVLRVSGRDGAAVDAKERARTQRVLWLTRSRARVATWQVRIQKESEVRLRIVGTRNDANEIVRPRSHAPFCHLCNLC
jgi:hypothetical protein